MRLQLSSFAGGRFLDRHVILKSLRQLSADLMNRDQQVLGVLLFGSLARSDYGRRSDADLLICLRPPRMDKPADRIPSYLALFLDAPVPVDVFPLTEDEIQVRLANGNPFWLRVRREVVLLAGEAPPSFAGSATTREQR